MKSCVEEPSMDDAYNLSITTNQLPLQSSASLNLVDSTLMRLQTSADLIKNKSCMIKAIASKQQETMQLNQCHLACLNAVLEHPIEVWSDLSTVKNQGLVYKALMVADVFLAQSLRIQAYAEQPSFAATQSACQALLVGALQEGSSIAVALWQCRQRLSNVKINRLPVKPKVAVALKSGQSLDSLLQLLQQQGVEVLLQSSLSIFLQEQAITKAMMLKLTMQFAYYCRLIGLKNYPMNLKDSSKYHILFSQWPMDTEFLAAALDECKQQAQAEFQQALDNCGLTAANVEAEMSRNVKLNSPLYHCEEWVVCTAANTVHAMLV